MSIWDGIFGRRKVKLTDPASWHHDHGTWSGKATSPDAVLQLATAWACIRLNARTKASLPLKVHLKKDGSLVQDSRLYALLHDQPNADQTALEFWEGQYTALELRGNAYAEKVYSGNELVALIPLNPDCVTVYRDPRTGERRYRFADSVTGFRSPQDGWGEDKVFHLRGFGAGGMTGLSTISYGRQTLSTALAADEVAGRTFAHGLQVSGFAVDSPGARTTQEQREDLVKLFDKFSGSQRAGKVMPLPPGFDFKALGMSPEDAQLLETRGFHVEEICRWFGMFPILIGHAAAGQTMWGSGVEQINLAWLTLYLGPELQRIEQSIEKQLLTPIERAKFYVEHNVDALLRADSAGRAALYSVQAQNGLKTRNEMRKRENDPPLPGGDVLTVQSNLVPLELLGKLPPSQTPDGFGHPPAPKPKPDPSKKPA
ncbi:MULTISPECIES: phage portal protein [unclassified Mesorhizobium]|uniref:phage portal protein n=1 Tax=unclassified Mesorhizobium TaxID=325217 RepID=UPI0011281F7A|nr:MULTISPECIES: phage portal protein [unclassified Mesorhizobium]MCA0025482.1 phage portal protein [Mesorhizobium sp. B263B1A]TPJ97130.1 phage portal protein [Mesorhizobium sp. B2-5-12]TPK27203.1 phage portal protein [Mesorhizobium sp. B2-5-6]